MIAIGLVLVLCALVAALCVRRWARRRRPRTAPPAPTPSAPPVGPVATEAPAPRPTVLIVDDDETVRESTARILARAGFEVLVASSAQAALELAADRSDSIDVVLSDVVMPGASGFELAAQLRERWPEIAVLLITGYTPRALDRHDLPGHDDTRLLRKPLERGELLDAIRSALAAAEN